MEFEDHEQQEDEEEEDDEEKEDEEITLPSGYDSSREKMSISDGEAQALALSSPTARKPRYRECLKNHAVGLGGHAVDGCGEFMPAGTEGTLDALICAACNCHRNFHRRETHVSRIGGLITSGGLPYHHNQQFSPAGYLHAAPHQRTMALPSTPGEGRGTHSREDQEDMSNPRGRGGGMVMGTGSWKKRIRTKFTQEQKERMVELAERLGWRIQKHDEGAVEQFCNETGVKRNGLKVWMHNNKLTLGKKPA